MKVVLCKNGSETGLPDQRCAHVREQILFLSSVY